MPDYLQIIVSLVIFLTTFWIIITEKANRSVIAFFGAVIMWIVGIAFWFYSPQEVLHSVDFNTILLLLGMMIIVAELEKTGFLQYLAIKTAKKTHGNTWILLVSLAWLTSVLSMFLDNVTTIILVVPVTLIITRILKINPIPILMSEAILSNIAWVGTLIWDPPNILIGSAANFWFNDFIFHSFPIVLISWLLILFFIKFSYQKELNNPQKWLKALQKMDANKCIKNHIILKKTLIVLVWVTILFFIHELLHLSASAVALLWASSLLLWVSPHKDPKSIFKKVELSVLVFFASLFVLVWWIEAAWVLDFIVDNIVQHAQQNILLTAIFILWFSAIVSAIIDNIPMTVAMLPVIAMLQSKGILWVEILWWALALWVWFGWNASPIGSTAGVIVMWKAESNKTPISTKDWLKVWIPATLISLFVSTFILIIFSNYYMF